MLSLTPAVLCVGLAAMALVWSGRTQAQAGNAAAPTLPAHCAQLEEMARVLPGANLNAIRASAGCQVQPPSSTPNNTDPQARAKEVRARANEQLCRSMTDALYGGAGWGGPAFWLGPLPVVIAREQPDRCGNSITLSPPHLALQEGLWRFDKGRFATSADAFREGLAVAQSDDMRMRLLAEMAKSLLAAQRTEDARAAVEQALAMVERAPAPRVPSRPSVPNAASLFGGGNNEKNIAQFMERFQREQDESQAATRTRLMDAELLVLAGLVDLQADRLPSAVERMRAADALSRADQADGSIVPSYLALALQRAGQPAEARKLLEDAMASREETLGALVSFPQLAESLKSVGMGEVIAGQERNMAAGAMTSGEVFLPSFACPLLEQIDAQGGQSPERALESAERCRSRALTRLLASRAFHKPLPSLQEMSDPRRRRTSAADQDWGKDYLSNPQAEAAGRPASVTDMRRMAAQRRATVVAYSIATTPNRLPSRMPDRETGVRMWVVSPDGRVTMRERGLAGVFDNVGDTHPLTEAIAHARQVFGVAGRGPVATVSARAPRVSKSSNELRRLYQLLIEPVADLLPAEAGARLLFVPQGPLFLVPFAALEDAGGAPLVSRYSISSTPSMQTLALTGIRRPMARTGGPDLVVGNPVMPQYTPVPGQPALDIPELPGAEEEARAISVLLKATPLTGAAATKAEVIRDARDARYIHLATHGFLDDMTERTQRDFNPNVRRVTMLGADVGNESKTPGMLALAPSGTDSGMLTSDEIAEASTNADLVVMSACDTGRGAINDEGVIGLSRAWMAAGAPSVIVSLWAIPDEPTRDLMVSFYGRLQQGAGKSEALRDAMMETRIKYPKTAYWAAFVLMGEPD